MLMKLILFLVKLSVIGFFTIIYVTPLFILFYVIIFQNFDLLNLITLKYYSISFGIGFLLLFISTWEWAKNSINDEK
jgi:hypothetical protein